MRVLRHIAVTAAFALLVSPLSAATVSKIDNDAFAPLRAQAGSRKLVLDKLPLYDSKRSVIELEEFSVWVPGGKVFVHDGKGNVTKLDPPAMRFFRGQVNGDPESFAYFSIEVNTGRIFGLVATRDANFAVDSIRRAPHGRNRGIDDGPIPSGDYDYYLTSTDANDMNTPTPAKAWECALEKQLVSPHMLRQVQTDSHGMPIQSQAISGTQHYSIKVEVETDDELCANAGGTLNCAANIPPYVTNLAGAVSTIYNRDLKTDVQISGIHTHTGGAGTDQWSSTTDALTALYEFGTYYHNNPGYYLGTHSNAVFLSGKNASEGIAWEATEGAGDFFCGADGSACDPNGLPNATAANQYGGGYAWCSAIGVGGLGTVPDPNATNGSGTLYGMPTAFQAYWPLEEFAHELGHNMAGHHAHCVGTTDAERIAAGFTDGSPATSASDFVDHCFGHEGLANCYAAATDYVAGSQSTFKGTIMGYCHNVFVGGVPQSRFTFGQAAEPSHRELDDYMLNATGPGCGTANGCNGSNIVTGTLTNVSAFNANATVNASSTGNTASVTASNAISFLWSITNGTITGGQGTSSITFTAGASGTMTLKYTAYGSNSCGITDSKTIAILTASYNPPTGLIATATGGTSVALAWTPPASGTTPSQYDVYRSANHLTYSLVGTTTGTGFTDTGAMVALSPNTAYLYKVRSANTGGTIESGDSNIDFTVTAVYTNTLTPSTSIVRAVDVNEIRTAVEAMRTLAGSGAGTYTFLPASGGTTIVHAADITQLRSNLSTALTSLGFSAPSYTNATITGGSSTVQAVDFNQLRAAMQ